MVVVQREGDLPDLIRALHPARRLPGTLHGRQKQGNQDADDGNHHQKLYQGKTV